VTVWTARTVRLAVVVYLVGIGVSIMVLSLQREPAEFAVLLRGVLVGAVLIHAAAPVLSYGSSSLRRDTFRWLISLLVTALTMYPRALFLPFIPIDFFVAGAGALATLMTGGLIVTTIEIVRTALRLLKTLVLERDRGGTMRALLAAGVGLSVGVVALVLTERITWTDPPFSWPVAVAGTIVLLVPIVATCARLVEAMAALDGNGSSAAAWSPIAGAVVATALWVQSADRLFPDGLWPATVTVISQDAGDQGRVELFLRTAERRTGFRGTSERFLVHIGPGLVPLPSNSLVDVRPNGQIEITLNAGLPADRVHNYLTVQFARTLAGIRLPHADATLVDGYAYWASENTRNPFFAGVASGASPAYACKAASTMTFLPHETFYYADTSLPFVVAERAGGVRGAQALMLEELDSEDDADALRERVDTACAEYLADFIAPPEIVIDAPADRPDLADDSLARRMLEEAKARSGLDAYGRPFVIRYASLPAGQQSTTDYSRLERTLVLISPQASLDERRTALLVSFVGTFLIVRYQGISPALVAGFSDWASRDPLNPFIGGPRGPDTPKTLCAYLPQADFATVSTKGAAWLSALPFVLAERRSGATGATALLSELVSERAPDLAAWRTRISSNCATFLAEGTPP
jgi:hypothetical protein